MSDELSPLPTKALGLTYEIIDREAMAEVAGWLIDNKAGSWSAVDEAMRQLQPTLSRMRRKRLPKIRLKTLNELFDQLDAVEGGAELKDRVFAAIMSPMAQGLWAFYRGWLNERIDKYKLNQTGDAHPSILSYVGYDDPANPHGAFRKLDPAVVQKMVPTQRSIYRSLEALHRIYSDDYCRRAARRFVDRAFGLGHDEVRIAYGVLRVAEPLADYEALIRIERQDTELSRKDLRRFIDAGFLRETILLDRPKTEDRIQALIRAVEPPTAKKRI